MLGTAKSPATSVSPTGCTLVTVEPPVFSMAITAVAKSPVPKFPGVSTMLSTLSAPARLIVIRLLSAKGELMATLEFGSTPEDVLESGRVPARTAE